MKVLVCGGRDYADYTAVCDVLDELDRKHGITHVIHGGASGADSLAAKWAQHSNAQEVRCPANWGRHGRIAGPMRNAAMAALKPDLVVVFPGGRGTHSMVCEAHKAGLRLYIVSQERRGEKTFDTGIIG